jgi:hypothetical protein
METKFWQKIREVTILVRNDMPEPANHGAALFWNEAAFEVVMMALKKAFVNKLITNEEWRWCECIKELIMQFESWKDEYLALKEADSSDLADLKNKK